MARSRQATEALSADDQKALDQMRADDQGPIETPQPPPEPAEAEPSQQPDEQQQQPPKMVPLAALHEERERRKEIDRVLADERRRMQTLEERTNLLLQRFGQPQTEQKPPEPTAQPIPKIEEDPVGHILATQRHLAQQLQENQQTWQQQQAAAQQQQQQMQVIAALTQRAQAAEQQFQLEHSDYPQAVQHLIRARHRELELVGVTDPAQRQGIIQQEGLQVAALAVQSGGDPAERIYELAKARGYAASPSQSSGAGESAGGDQQAAQRLQNIAAGQQQSRSLGNARGTAPPPLTAKSLIEMPPDEFAKMIATPEGKALLGT